MSLFLFKESPSRFVVLFAVAAVEGGVVFDGALDGAAGLGVVGDGAGEDAAGGSVLHGAVGGMAGEVDGGRGVFDLAVDAQGDALRLPRTGVFKGLATDADAGEAAVVGEGDAAVGVVPGGRLVLLEHRELDAVDGLKLIQRHAQRHGREHIDLHEGLTAFEVGAERGSPRPCLL